jgi:uncharacterized metal-binding protein YceD (DUF177 family)
MTKSESKSESKSGEKSGEKPEPPSEPRWRVPVRLDGVPETGLHLDLVADAQVCAGLAARAGVRDISRLEAAIDLARQGDALRATGRLSADVGQTCVVSLDPLENRVDEPVDIIFASPEAMDAVTAAHDTDEPPELLLDGVADLGAVLGEFLLLGIDPYPRKPDAVFAPSVEAEAGAGPFAVLAKLKDPGS